MMCSGAKKRCGLSFPFGCFATLVAGRTKSGSPHKQEGAAQALKRRKSAAGGGKAEWGPPQLTPAVVDGRSSVECSQKRTALPILFPPCACPGPQHHAAATCVRPIGSSGLVSLLRKARCTPNNHSQAHIHLCSQKEGQGLLDADKEVVLFFFL